MGWRGKGGGGLSSKGVGREGINGLTHIKKVFFINSFNGRTDVYGRMVPKTTMVYLFLIAILKEMMTSVVGVIWSGM